MNGTQYCDGGAPSTYAFGWGRGSLLDDHKSSYLDLLVFYTSPYMFWELYMVSKEERDGFPDYTGTAWCSGDAKAPKPTDCNKQ